MYSNRKKIAPIQLQPLQLILEELEKNDTTLFGSTLYQV